MNARNFSIIRPYVHSCDGSFVNKYDSRYQLINWTGIYQVTLRAYKKESGLYCKTITGSFEDCKRIYDANPNDDRCISEVRILGNGEYDTCCHMFAGNVRSVPENFEFAEVAE